MSVSLNDSFFCNDICPGVMTFNYLGYDEDTSMIINNEGHAQMLSYRESWELVVDIVKPWRKTMCLEQEKIEDDPTYYFHVPENDK